ncbi:MAG: hypothetical protein ACJAWV_001826 [Flammeovirgaceae bacterium]|jgi:hypothetical protein
MILKFKLLGSSVDAWEAPLEPVLLLVFRVLTNSKNKLISSNLSFVIPFNQIHDRASLFIDFVTIVHVCFDLIYNKSWKFHRKI